MFGLNILTTPYGFLLAALVVVLAYKLLAYRIRTGDTARQNGFQDDTRLIQQMYRRLERMEERIDTLETLLVDPSRKRKPAAKDDFDEG